MERPFASGTTRSLRDLVSNHLLTEMILQVDTKSPSTKMISVTPAGDKNTYTVYSIDGYVLRVGTCWKHHEGGICFIPVKEANTMIHSEFSYIHILNVIFENFLTWCLKENGWRISISPYKRNTSTTLSQSDTAPKNRSCDQDEIF